MQWATVRILVAAVAGGLAVCGGSAGASAGACSANASSTALILGLADKSCESFLDDIIVIAEVVPAPSSLSIFGDVLFGLDAPRRQRAGRPARATEDAHAARIMAIAASGHTISKVA